MDLSKPIIYLAVLAGAAQFIQSKMMEAKQKKANIGKDISKTEPDMTTIMTKQMTYMFPIMTVIIGLTLPGGLTLYWFMFTALTALQQFIVLKTQKKSAISGINGPIEGEIIK